MSYLTSRGHLMYILLLPDLVDHGIHLERVPHLCYCNPYFSNFHHSNYELSFLDWVRYLLWRSRLDVPHWIGSLIVSTSCLISWRLVGQHHRTLSSSSVHLSSCGSLRGLLDKTQTSYLYILYQCLMTTGKDRLWWYDRYLNLVVPLAVWNADLDISIGFVAFQLTLLWSKELIGFLCGLRSLLRFMVNWKYV